ncbi:MAG: hypothetical protein IPN74_16685 [Haliscomenobacter sp.]|nr:hypothetical protein [Haliscomenobacter sp.]
MEELRELTYIITKNPPDSMRFIGPDFWTSDSKMQRLLTAIRDGKVEDDLDAAELLYGERLVSGKYRNLKHELRRRLINTVFLLPTSTDKDRDTAYFNCWKDWAVCQILIEKSSRYSATTIAQRILKNAIRYDFLNLVHAIALYLRNHYALRERDKSKFQYYDELYQRYREEEDWTNLAHKYYMSLILEHALDSVVANRQIQIDAHAYLRELYPLRPRIENVKFHYYLFQIELLGKMGVFLYAEAKEVCARAIDFLNKSNVQFSGGILNFLLNKLVCHIQLREFDQGEKTALACNELVEQGTFNWFKTQEYLFLLAFHTGNYQRAYQSYYLVVNNPRYNTYAILHETWALHKMYLHFLYLLGKVMPRNDDKSFTAIRLGKFLNEVPSFSKDKQGMNIPVLIIQMAFLILQRNYDLATERIDAVNKYCDRYLKTNSPNFRSNCFIKMLQQIPKSDFHRTRTQRSVEPYLKQMNTIAVNFNSQAHEIEIIPFADFWQLILSTLDNKFNKVK